MRKGIDYGTEGKALICPQGTGTTNPVGFTFPNAAYGGAFTGGVTNCNPNTSMTQFGTRTMWNPVPDVDVGFDVGIYHVNTAFQGQANLPAYGTQFLPSTYQRGAGTLQHHQRERARRGVPLPAQLPVLSRRGTVSRRQA